MYKERYLKLMNYFLHLHYFYYYHLYHRRHFSVGHWFHKKSSTNEFKRHGLALSIIHQLFWVDCVGSIKIAFSTFYNCFLFLYVVL